MALFTKRSWPPTQITLLCLVFLTNNIFKRFLGGERAILPRPDRTTPVAPSGAHIRPPARCSPLRRSDSYTAPLTIVRPTGTMNENNPRTLGAPCARSSLPDVPNSFGTQKYTKRRPFAMTMYQKYRKFTRQNPKFHSVFPAQNGGRCWWKLFLRLSENVGLWSWDATWLVGTHHVTAGSSRGRRAPHSTWRHYTSPSALTTGYLIYL